MATPTSAREEPVDPLDPLAPRPDDPRLGRRWWARLYDRPDGRAPLRSPLTILVMLAIVIAAAGLVVWLRVA